MAVFEITAPDGKVFEIEGENAQGALSALQKHLGGVSSAPAEPMPMTGDATAETARDVAAQRLIRGVKRAGVMPDEELKRIAGGADKAVRMIANGMTFGMADRAAGGMDALTGRAPSYAEGVKAQHAQTEQIKKDAPGLAMAGEAVGGLATGAGLIKSGISLVPRLGPSLLPRVFGFGAEGAAYGAAHGAGNTYSDKPQDFIENAKTGAATGLLIGGGLPLAGAGAGAAYRAGSAFMGPRIEGLGRGASSMMRGAAQADEAGLRNLSTMGPDAMLVDAGPAMLGMGQGAATGTGQGRSMLVRALQERDAATAPRLARVLDNELGPAPMPSRIEAELAGNRAYVGQEYEPVIANAGRVDTSPLAARLDTLAVNLRGPEQRAVRQVRDMLDIPGAPGNLDPHPRALLSTRQAIDGMLKEEKNPRVIQQLTVARQQVDDELARAAPGIKDVDAQFEELSRQSGGLQRGGQLFDTGKEAVRPQELTNEIAQGVQPQGTMIGPSAVPLRMREGARAEIDRVVGTSANDLNALERKLATPQDWNSQKFATIFGEGPHQRVAKALMDNRQFRDSYQKIVQNSQTAQRVESAAAMKGAEGGNVPHDVTMTGLGLRALNAVAKAISGASNANTKDEIGRILSTQGPAVQRIARELLQSAQQTGNNSRAINRVLSSPYWIGAGTAADR